MNSTDGLPTPRRYWAIITISLATVLSVLDSTIANVALPTIAHELNLTSATSILIINIYQLMIVVAMLPLAALGDIVGYRRVFQGGLAVFIVASVACALADSLTTLVIARAFQGLGAAGTMCVTSALVRATYPALQLGRGIGINAAMVSISGAIGPTIGGALLAIAPWQWLFAVNVPIGLISLAIGWFVLPQNEKNKKPYDFFSALLNVLTFGLFIIGLTGLAHNQSGTLVALELGFSVIFGTIFVRRQLAQPAPLLPVDLMKQPVIALSFTAALCSFIAMMLVLISLPFYLQGSAGFTPVETGLMIMPWPLAVGMMSPLSGYLADRYPAGILGGIGLAIASISIGLLALLIFNQPSVDAISVAWRMALCGIGYSLFLAPNARILISSAPVHRTGSIGGMMGTTRLTGQAVGAAIVALIFNLFETHNTTIALSLASLVVLFAASLSLFRLKADALEPKRKIEVVDDGGNIL